MTIGIDVSGVIYGTGVSDYILNLVKEMHKSTELTLFGSSLRRQSELKGIFPQAKTFPIPPTVLDFLWNKLHLLDVQTFTGKIDVFHSSDWTEPPCRVPKVTTIHDLSPFLYTQEMDPKIVAVHSRKMQWSLKECRKFICVSQNTANDLMRLFAVDPAKITVIPEALPARFQLSPRVTKFTNYIVTIGARQPRKNIERLVSAYLANKEKLDLPKKLIIIGENSQQVAYDSVTYTGYVDDQTLVDLLAGASAFVYPSLYEGFGLPILGAFYHGVPVACSSTSSLPEVAGDAAAMFDPTDEEEIGMGIKEAITEKEKWVKRGKTQLEKFSWATAASETLKVYQSVA